MSVDLGGELFERIKHGDAAHRDWLRDELRVFFSKFDSQAVRAVREKDLAFAHARDCSRQLNEQFERTLALEVEVQTLRAERDRALTLRYSTEAQALHFLSQRMELERIRDAGGSLSEVATPEGGRYDQPASAGSTSVLQDPLPEGAAQEPAEALPPEPAKVSRCRCAPGHVCEYCLAAAREANLAPAKCPECDHEGGEHDWQCPNLRSLPTPDFYKQEYMAHLGCQAKLDTLQAQRDAVIQERNDYYCRAIEAEGRVANAEERAEKILFGLEAQLTAAQARAKELEEALSGDRADKGLGAEIRAAVERAEIAELTLSGCEDTLERVGRVRDATQEDNERLKAQLKTCIACGQSPESLKEHIATCPEHPAVQRAEEFKRIGQGFERESRKHFEQSCINLERAEKACEERLAAERSRAIAYEERDAAIKANEETERVLQDFQTDAWPAGTRQELIQLRDEKEASAQAVIAATERAEKAERERADVLETLSWRRHQAQMVDIAKLTEERDAERDRATEAEQLHNEALSDCEDWLKQAQVLSTELGQAEATIGDLREALDFYSDPENYHGIGFLVDPPAGGFAEDFDEDHGHPNYDRPMPGKLAREVLAAHSEPAEVE